MMETIESLQKLLAENRAMSKAELDDAIEKLCEVFTHEYRDSITTKILYDGWELGITLWDKTDPFQNPDSFKIIDLLKIICDWSPEEDQNSHSKWLWLIGALLETRADALFEKMDESITLEDKLKYSNFATICYTRALQFYVGNMPDETRKDLGNTSEIILSLLYIQESLFKAYIAQRDNPLSVEKAFESADKIKDLYTEHVFYKYNPRGLKIRGIDRKHISPEHLLKDVEAIEYVISAYQALQNAFPHCQNILEIRGIMQYYNRLKEEDMREIGQNKEEMLEPKTPTRLHLPQFNSPGALSSPNHSRFSWDVAPTPAKKSHKHKNVRKEPY